MAWCNREIRGACLPILNSNSPLTLSSSNSNTSFTWSIKHQANVFKMHVHDVCSNYLTFARCLLCVGYASFMLDVCSMFAWWCKHGITRKKITSQLQSRKKWPPLKCLEYPFNILTYKKLVLHQLKKGGVTQQ